jgi:polyisoprenoid-binding protein YceI
MKTLALFAALTLSAVFATAAHAAAWRVLPGSTLGFAGSFQGAGFSGHFKRFSAAIVWDPAHPQACHFDVRVDLASADTANSQRDELLPGADFFDVAKFPQARFVASGCKAMAGGALTTTGTLSLRGISRPVALTLRSTPQGKDMLLTVNASLDRLAFGVGGGQWADSSTIGRAVTVNARLLLAPQ